MHVSDVFFLWGLQVVYMRIFDIQQRRTGWHTYFYPVCVGYGLGLLLTYGALLLNIGGQQVQCSILTYNPKPRPCFKPYLLGFCMSRSQRRVQPFLSVVRWIWHGLDPGLRCSVWRRPAGKLPGYCSTHNLANPNPRQLVPGLETCP